MARLASFRAWLFIVAAPPCHPALTWQKYTHEALLAALLVLFSPQAMEVEQALAILKPWMARCEVNLVTRALLTDALNA
ncbi:hypothetical protein PR003_g26956 [Phytophthora rubi]|uniref:Uncharacterized protein n=2 Tax=Phytophthora rubi TaxID=129364 RepID=A0A6A4CB66_9STRA|nr:hypothetical protein PR003_g26956 [Phytophthora rubi]